MATGGIKHDDRTVAQPGSGVMPRHVYRIPCICEAREAHSLTVEKLAGMAGITIGHLSKVERGISAPSAPVTRRIADAERVGPSDCFQPDAS